MDLSDGYRAVGRWWRPAHPRGVVLYFHGIQSHGGWYEASASRLGEQDLFVFMPDRRGSGLNRDQRGHTPSLTRCLGDARECLDAALRESGQQAVHLVGVSWGGKLCAYLAGSAPDRVASMTLVAPGIFPRVDVSPLEKMRIALSMVNDRTRPYDIPLNDPGLFTANPERIRFVQEDSLKLEQVTAGFLLASRRLDRIAARLSFSEYRGPVHLMLAGRDRIIDNQRTAAWLRDLPSPNRRITTYPEACHTLEFEDDPSAFLDDLCRGITAYCAQGESVKAALPNRATHP